MADDLDAFLQRAAQQRQKRKQAEIVILEPSSSAPAAPARPAAPVRTIAPPQRPAAPPQRLGTPSAAPAPVVVIAEPVDTANQDFNRRVAGHLDTRDFEQRASHLGERVGLADDNLEAHLQQVFQHQVGSIGKPGETQQSSHEVAAANMSLEILATFRDPMMLRRAIILNEVLTPPFHRW